MKTAAGRAHHITITHLGYERFRTAGDKAFPGGDGPDAYVDHLPFKRTVRYNPAGLRYDAGKARFHPGSFKGLPDMEDGNLDDLGLRAAATAAAGNPGAAMPLALPSSGKYAPIGPFGRWRIEARPRDNGLGDDDRSMLAGLSAIVIDFHGFYREFT
jgi:hypothetical protein